MKYRSSALLLAASIALSYGPVGSSQEIPGQTLEQLDQRIVRAKTVAEQIGAVSWPLYNDATNPLKKEEGRRTLDQGMRANPANPYLRVDRGFMYLQDKQPCEARREFINAYQQVVHISAGRLEDWRGRLPEGIERAIRIAEFDIRGMDAACR